jgi:hypothetical protein
MALARPARARSASRQQLDDDQRLVRRVLRMIEAAQGDLLHSTKPLHLGERNALKDVERQMAIHGRGE